MALKAGRAGILPDLVTPEGYIREVESIKTDMEALSDSVDALEENKADKATKLSGYGITDALTSMFFIKNTIPAGYSYLNAGVLRYYRSDGSFQQFSTYALDKDISVNQTLTEGTEIGSITVGTTETKLYAPEGGSGGLTVTTLWTNGSTSSTFASQTITLSDAYENYDYIGVVFAQGSGSAGRVRMMPMIFMPVSATYNVAEGNLANYRNFLRTITFSGGTSATVSNCSYYATYGTDTASTSNGNLIPRFIYGFKQN